MGEGKDEDGNTCDVCMQDKESHRRLTWIPSQGTPVANAKEARLVNKPRVRGLRTYVRACDALTIYTVSRTTRSVLLARRDSVSLARRRQFFLEHPVYLGNFPSLPSLVEPTWAFVYRGWVSCEIVGRCTKKGTKGGGALWRR